MKAKFASLLFAATLAGNCSGKTYSTLLQPFDIVFGSANSSVSVGLAGATPLSPTRVRVEFSKPITLDSAENTANYVITDSNGTRLDILAVTRDPFNSSVIYIDTSLHTAGLTYTVQAANLVGVDGATLSSSASRGTYTAPNNVDATAPTIAAASMSSTSKLNITFNEAVDLTTAQVSGNYTFYTNATCTTGFTTTISNLSRDTLNFAKVSMDLTGPSPTGGTTYYVRVNAVKDIWGNAMSNVCSPAWVGFGAAVAPKVSSAVSQSTTSVLVTFDSAMTVTGGSLTQLQTAGNYTFSNCSGANLTMGSAVSVNSTQVLLTGLGNAGVANGSCRLTVNAGTGILGSNGAALSGTNNTANFPYSTSDTTGPVVGSVSAVNATTVRVTFNEPIQATGPSASNFSFSPALTVGAISCNASRTSCDVTTSPQTTQSYTATVSGITDAAGNAMASSTTTFTGEGKPYVDAMIPIDLQTVRVQFSRPVSGTINTGDFLINGVQANTATFVPAGATSSDVIELRVATAWTSGATQTVVFLDDAPNYLSDAVGNRTLYDARDTTTGQTLTFVAPTITNAPVISSVTAVNASTVRVTFDQPLDNSLLATGDFAISVLSGSCPAATPTGATQVQAGVVQLAVTSNTGNGTCRVTVGAGNVTSIYGVNNAVTTGDFTYTGSATTDTTQPTVLSAISISNTQVRIFFSEPVVTDGGTNAANTLANYSLSPTLSIASAGADCATLNTTVCTITTAAQSSTQYTLSISNIQDKATPTANTMASQSLTFYGTGGTAAAPTLYQAVLVDPTTLELSFTEQMDLTTSQVTGSYTITTSATAQSVTAAARQADATKVRLTLSPGAFGSSNSFTVTVATAVQDVGGNGMGTPLSQSFSGFANAPSTGPALAAASDTGISNSDRVTNPAYPSPGLQFTGTVTANTVVILYQNGVAVGSTTSDSSGNYSITLTSSPGSGTFNYTVATVTNTGTISSPSPVVQVVSDTTPPATPGSAPVLATASDSGISNSDGITNLTTGINITGTIAADATYDQRVDLYDGTTLVSTVTVTAGSTAYSFTGVSLAAGAHSLTVKVRDAANNESAAASPALSVTVNTTAASITGSSIASTNAYVAVTFSEGVYGSATSSTALTSTSAFTINTSGGVATAAINCITNNASASCPGTAPAAGDTTVRVHLTITGVPNGSEQVTINAAANSIYDNAGNASATTVTTGAINLNAAGIANITGGTYTAVGAAGSTTGYVTVNFSNGAYTSAGPAGALVAGDFTGTLVATGNATSVTVSCVTDTASTSCPGTAPAAGATSVRVQLTFNNPPSGVETVRLNAGTNEIFGTGGATPDTSNTGALAVTDRLAPTISSVSPATNAFVTNTQVSYTINENCASGNVTWTRTGGTADGASPHTQALTGSELTAGTKTNITLTNNPTLVSQAVYTVSFNCTDAAGNAATAVSSTSVTYDTTAPTVTSVNSSTADGSYGVGSAISIQVNFSETVVVTGTPQLTLETGTTDAVVDYVSGSNSNQLTFTYTVVAGHTATDLDFQSTLALALNSGTIRDLSNNNATLTLATPGAANSLGANKAIVIDTTAPTVTNVTSSLADGSYTTGQAVSIQITFSENITVTGTPQLTLTTGTPATTAINFVNVTGGNTMNFTYTVAAGNTTSDLDYASTGALALNSGTIRDTVGTNPNNATLTLAAPGAANSLGANKAIVIDTTAPTVTGVTATNADATYGTGVTISIQVTFSETVNVAGGTPTLTLNTSPSRTASYTGGTGSTTLTFEYTVVSGDTSADLDFASTGALALGGATIRDAALNNATLTLMSPGAAGSLGANKAIVINASVSFTITTAETLDCDPVDGIIDHYRVTFGAAARDNTFDGYVVNAEGLPTGKWIVAGRSNVRLHHGSSLPTACGTDTANDTVIYIKFNQGATVDTGSLPDLTGNNDTLAANSDGTTKLFSNTGIWNTTDVTETDKAGPYVYFANAAEAGASEAGVGPGDTLTLRFSERTNAPGTLASVSLDTIFELNNSHLFGVAGNVTSANWTTTTFTNDTLTITFANTTPTVAVGDTIKLKPQATLTDNATNQASATTDVTSPPTIGGTFTPGQVGPVISSATYLDTDADGYIDTVQVVFSTTVQDDSFNGYALNALGTVTTQWAVAGYNNVRLIHGTAVTFATDTANDNTIYLRFAEGSSYDTGVKPDLTATDQSLYGPAGGALGTTACYVNTSVGAANCNTIGSSDVLTASVVELDGALPIIVKATAKVGSTSVFISFSENVWSDAGLSACGSGGQIVAADFTYVDGNAAAPNTISSIGGVSSDSCASGDAFIEAVANGSYATGDLNIDKIRAATATSIYDGAANGMATSREQVIAEATAPYVLAASTYYSGGNSYARIFFSEPVSNSAATNAYSAFRLANYTIQRSSGTACPAFDSAVNPSAIVAVGGSNRVFDLQTPAQCSGTTYQVTALTTIKDIDEFENVTTPNFAFAVGTVSTDTTRPRLLLARSLSSTTVELTFSEPMMTGTGANSAACASAAVCATEDADTGVSGTQSKYWLTPTGLGNVTSVAATADTSVYVLTHATAQQGNFYTVNAYATSTGNRIPQDVAGNNLETAPGNQAVFQGAGTPIVTFNDGAVFNDPFSDGTKFNFAFGYQNKIYLGPNDQNNAAFRFEADGLNPVGVSFLTTGGGTCTPATSFGITSGTCGAQTTGPNGERGIVSFNSGTVTVSSTDYEVLLLGPLKDGVTRTYFTQDVDTQLDWNICSFSVTGGGNTKSIQASYAFKGNDKYYSGFSSDHGTQAPILAATPLTASGGVLSCGSGSDLTLRSQNYLGKNGSPNANPAKAASSSAVVGIDSMLYVTTTPTPAAEFYVANNGGVASAATPFTSYTTRVSQADFAGVSGAGAVTLVLPNAPAGLEKVRPGQKGMPLMTVWNGAIYAARNLAVSQTAANQIVNNGAELWKCTSTCTSAANWRLVLSTNNVANTMSNRANLKAISLLQVNGNFLYIGFDNPTDGAQIYRSQSGITEIDGTTACTGGDTTANNGDGYRCFQQQGATGLGVPSENQYFFSSASIRKGASNFIYVTVGDANLVAIKVLRQID